MHSQFTMDILNVIEINLYTTKWDLAASSPERTVLSPVLMIYDLVSKFAWFRPLNFMSHKEVVNHLNSLFGDLSIQRLCHTETMVYHFHKIVTADTTMTCYLTTKMSLDIIPTKVVIPFYSPKRFIYLFYFQVIFAIRTIIVSYAILRITFI